MLPHFLASGVDVVLVYSVRHPAEAAFLSEFDRTAAVTNPKPGNRIASAKSAPAAAQQGPQTHGTPTLRVVCTASANAAGAGTTPRIAPAAPAERKGPRPSGGPLPGLTWHAGRVSKELLAAEVPEIGRQRVYMCGPESFMESAVAMLAALGVPADAVFQESFNF